MSFEDLRLFSSVNSRPRQPRTIFLWLPETLAYGGSVMPYLDATTPAVTKASHLHLPRQAPATIAIVGLGGIGAAAAGCLYDAGRHHVVACARRPLDGFVLERPEGAVEVPLRTLTDPADAQGVDWVLLCTKAHQTPSTAPWLARLCHSSTRVAVLQNGIGHAARTAPFVGEATIVPTIVWFSGERLGADRTKLRHMSSHDLAVADDANGQAFAQLFNGTSLHVLLSTDLAKLSWQKLLINAVVNPITALTLQRMSVFRHNEVATLCAAILDEAAAVARAAGIEFAAGEVSQIMSALLALPAEAGTSMYFDRLAGRELEVEALTGAIVAAGERLGISVPLNRAILTLLRAINDARENSSASPRAFVDELYIGDAAIARPQAN
jgi:2-dehydropantoate 2-reductase